ncbi:dephospho-CoA kinase [Nitrosococcus watsonii]|uniref:Dephospho-CoA kinase n=1 Tax=Nitrosococcus watsoni (strain C-113) TaxID=105559 RepID=D8KA56_NITWC|nr:dephospho-CoA kinase [Nitrosococcus watsonii]ADJ27371.1 dephospho-CoA kinase [Nitrosococcus watsonii C-113]
MDKVEFSPPKIPSKTPYKVGLTGGIGSGKSTAARSFSELGVPVIDADIIARELVEPGQPALAEIVATFGREILNPQGGLDRSCLRRLVFTSEALKTRLEAILHPRILQEMERRATRLTTPYCVLVIPLLVETGQKDIVDRTLVIDIPDAIQRQRVKARDRLSDTEIDAILQTQSRRAARLAAADDIIVNDTDLATLQRQVEHYHQKYLFLTSQQRS